MSEPNIAVAVCSDGSVDLRIGGHVLTFQDWQDVIGLADTLMQTAAVAARAVGASPAEVEALLVHMQDQHSAEIMRQIRGRP